MRELADVHYPEAERVRVVLDNLSTHSAGALYQTFPADEARRVLRRLEFHYVPRHASWLNMVEIEIGVLGLPKPRPAHRKLRAPRHRNRCLGEATQRRARPHQLEFTTEKARTKMGRAYPKPASASG